MQAVQIALINPGSSHTSVLLPYLRLHSFFFDILHKQAFVPAALDAVQAISYCCVTFVCVCVCVCVCAGKRSCLTQL